MSLIILQIFVLFGVFFAGFCALMARKKNNYLFYAPIVAYSIGLGAAMGIYLGKNTVVFTLIYFIFCAVLGWLTVKRMRL